MPHIVIIGGGFGGLTVAQALPRAPAQVTLIDRQNYHLFQPLLYQVATAGLSPGDIASPIRWVLRRQRNVVVRLATVTAIDTPRRLVRLEGGDEIGYDYLVVATGATNAYFGHDEWRDVAPGLKTLEDGLDIRRRVLLAYERAEQEPDPARQREQLTFVVVGGGPTGVELAGALAEMARHTLARDFRRINTRATRLVLVEGGPAILASFPPPLQAAAERSLGRLGVEVRKNALVTRISPGRVEVGEDTIAANNVLWTAGIEATSLGRTLGAPLDRAGRVVVQPDLTVPGHPEVFVIGDLAAFVQDGQLLPGVAPVAMQQGQHAARNILAAMAGRSPEAFRYRNPGNMATIGRAAAVADFGWLRISGWIAWVAWLFVHILNLTGFRNRLVVLVQWGWAYFTYQRNVRLITGQPPVPRADSTT